MCGLFTSVLGYTLFFALLHATVPERAYRAILKTKYANLPSGTKDIWNANAMSLMYAAYVVPLIAVYLCEHEDVDIDMLHGASYSPLATHVIRVSSGFFLWDLLFCLKCYDTWGLMYIIHAMFSFSTFFYVATTRIGVPLAMRILLYEFSTIFLHIRTCLKDLKLYEKWIWHVVNFTFAVSFFVFRIFYGFSVCFITTRLVVQDERISLLTKFMVMLNITLSSLLNLMWAQKIVCGLKTWFYNRARRIKRQ